MDITDMHFHNRCGNGGNGIPYSYRRMSIAARVDDDAIIGESNFLQMVDELPLYITLKIAEVYGRECLLQLSEILFEGLAAVHFRLPGTQEVEVRTVDDGNLHT